MLAMMVINTDMKARTRQRSICLIIQIQAPWTEADLVHWPAEWRPRSECASMMRILIWAFISANPVRFNAAWYTFEHLSPTVSVSLYKYWWVMLLLSQQREHFSEISRSFMWPNNAHNKRKNKHKHPADISRLPPINASWMAFQLGDIP